MGYQFNIKTQIFLLVCLLFNASVWGIVNTEILRKNSEGPLSQQLNLGLSLKQGSTESKSTQIDYRLDYDTADLDGFFTSSFTRSKASRELYENEGFVHLRAAKSLFKISVIEAFVQYEYDEFRDLQSRELFGVGRRFHFTQENLDIRLGLGAMLEREKYRSSKKIQNVIRSTNYAAFNYQQTSEISYQGTLYVQPLWRDFEDVRGTLELSMKSKLSQSVILTQSMTAQYDSRPPAGVSQTQYGVFSKVGVGF